jgi:hypothetical protein
MDEKEFQNGQYRIKMRKGNIEFEVSGPNEVFVIEQTERLLEQFANQAEQEQVAPVPQKATQELPPATQVDAAFRLMKPESFNEFYRKYKPQSNLEKILLFGYWFEMKQQQESFTQEDILGKFKEAKEPNPANLKRDILSLVTKGWFLTDKSQPGVYSLSNSGIQQVESKLPV